jgi:hypothetical protein
MHMSKLGNLVFQSSSLPILVKTTAIGIGSNQVRLGDKVFNGLLICYAPRTCDHHMDL